MIRMGLVDHFEHPPSLLEFHVIEVIQTLLHLILNDDVVQNGRGLAVRALSDRWGSGERDE